MSQGSRSILSQGLELENSDSASADDPSSQTPVDSSGVSCVSSPAGPTAAMRPSILSTAASAKKKTSTAAPVFYKCTFQGCKRKPYKSKAWFENHLAAHRIAAVNDRMPSQEAFLNVINDLIRTVLQKILLEPKVGRSDHVALKFQCLNILLDTMMEDSTWCKFVSNIAGPLYTSLANPTKMFPQHRYEEALKKLNTLLGSPGVIEDFVSQFQSVSTGIDLPTEVVRPLVCRISCCLLDELQIFIAKELRDDRVPDQPEPEVRQPMSEKEREAFIDRLGNLIRSFFLKALRKQSTSKMWRSLANCLKTKFVYYPAVPHPVSSAEFSEKKLWYNDTPEKSITLCEDVVKFFECVEMQITVFKKDKKTIKLASLENVLSSILSNVEVMNLWCALTEGYFSEENAVYVMKQIISSFHELSSRLEQERVNRAEEIQRETQTALRTGLKK